MFNVIKGKGENMEGIILFKSKYGSVKKYAQWLGEFTGFLIKELSQVSTKEVAQYQWIILCGGIYASGISGIKFISKNMKELKEKNLVIFAVGASHYDEDYFEKIKKHNLKEEMENIPMFYGRGAWDEETMTFKDRTLCKMLQKMLSKKNPKDYEPGEDALMSSMGQKKDWTDKKYLEPLLKYIEREN